MESTTYTTETPEILLIPEGELIEYRGKVCRLKEECVVELWDERKDERIAYGWGMTPEQAESIYYRALQDYRWNGREPLDEMKRRTHGWQAVIDAVRSEYSREIAGQMLTNIEKDAK